MRSSCHQRKAPRRDSFTLIELLVVISIIAVLAGIALPTYRTVQERGYMTRDASNLRQLGTGIAAYLNDNGNDLSALSTGSTGWTGTLYPNYVSNETLHQSHFDTRSPATSTAGVWSGPASFGINGNCFKVSNVDKWTSASSLALVVPAMGSDGAFHGTLNDGVVYWNGFKGGPLVEPPSAGLLSQPNGSAPTTGVYGNKTTLTVMYGDFHVQQNMSFITYKSLSTTAGDPADILWNPQSPTPLP